MRRWRTWPAPLQRTIRGSRDHDFACCRYLHLGWVGTILGDSMKIPHTYGNQRRCYDEVLHFERCGSKGQAILVLTFLHEFQLPLRRERVRRSLVGRYRSRHHPSERKAIDWLLEKTPRNRGHQQRNDAKQHQAQ